MPPGSRKRVSGAGDDLINNEKFPSKKAKTEASNRDAESSSHCTGTAMKWKVDANGDKFWELSKMRRVTISSFRGKTLVNIREYYEKDGQELPGKKGISLPIDQFSSLIALLPDIETALRESGVFVSRPDYSEATATDQLAESRRDEKEPSAGSHPSRKNIDATSDEDGSEE